MNRSVILNILRYVVSIFAPFFFCYNPLVALLAVVLLLCLNNILDDVSFYYANAEVKSPKINQFSSPVNGVVTNIEHSVPLFSHIEKRDVLTDDELLGIDQLQHNNALYTHVAIFLNKFNHHVVFNPKKLCSFAKIFSHRQSVEMVDSGKLVTQKSGEFTNNPAIVLNYEDMHMVLTLDKYVSKYILGSNDKGMPAAMLLRGSQCDIYASYPCTKKIGDIVQIGDKLFLAPSEECDSIQCLKRSLLPHLIRIGVREAGGVKKIVYDNVVKTLKTFKHKVLSAIVVVFVSLYIISPMFSYVAFLGVYLFAFERFYRNLMYSLMNAIGLKNWMKQSYAKVSKLQDIWKKQI